MTTADEGCVVLAAFNNVSHRVSEYKEGLTSE